MQAKTITLPRLTPVYQIHCDGARYRTLVLPSDRNNIQVVLCWADLSEHPPLKALGKNFIQDITKALYQRFLSRPGFNQNEPEWLNLQEWRIVVPDLLRKTVHKIQNVLREQSWLEHEIHAGLLLCTTDRIELWWSGPARLTCGDHDITFASAPAVAQLKTDQVWELQSLTLDREAQIEIRPLEEKPDDKTYTLRFIPLKLNGF